MSLSQKYQEKIQNFSFLARHNFKTESCRYIHIVIFGKILSKLFLDPQCIIGKEDFQHKILNWSNLLPSLSLHTSRARKGDRNYENRLSIQKQLSQGVTWKISVLKIFGSFHENTRGRVLFLVKLQGL